MSPRVQRKRPLGRPRKADRDPHGLSSRERILAAASRLFAERGHDATTMEDVAARSGFTAGALYRHFRGKPDLLLAVIAAALERIPAFQRRAARPRGRVAQTIGIYVTPQAEEIRRLAREVHATARRDRRVRRLLDGFNRRIRAAATARLAALRGADLVASADVTADLLLVIVLGLVHLDTLAPDRCDRPAFRVAVERAVERILGL